MLPEPCTGSGDAWNLGFETPHRSLKWENPAFAGFSFSRPVSRILRRHSPRVADSGLTTQGRLGGHCRGTPPEMLWP
jgi:hypothetical protein